MLLTFRVFFFHVAATTGIYTLSLHDALPISASRSTCSTRCGGASRGGASRWGPRVSVAARGDRKSTRLNSSHQIISYAVFCLKKKKLDHVPPPIVLINNIQRPSARPSDLLAL